ncbi:MAG: shikimate kinase [Verrucomicrobiales bacterium]|nr:shikimate kinase [Verrucomicrobiales bacterium]
MLALVHTTDQKSRNLILIGFMGTGKTTIGKRVASSLGFRFVDTDARITKAAGKPITKIFEEDGEEAFRALETKILQACAEQSDQVISTGGGIVTQPKNREILARAGFVIWLKASPETIYERIRHNRSRPLLKTTDPQATIRDLLAERSDLYDASKNLAVTTDGLTLEETCFGVTESARVALGMI